MAVCCVVATAGISNAGAKTKAAKEAAEYVFGKFGKEAAEEGVETLTRKIEVLAAKHGDEAFAAVKKVGPRALVLAEEAGEMAPQAVKLMSRYGDDALWVVAKKSRMSMFTKYGDNAAEAMLRHGEVAEPLIRSMGKPAAEALKVVTPQSGRRLAMMAEEGALKKIGKTEQLLGVVGKYGDRGMDFIWKHKGSLAVATALTAFLADPQPFIDGTKDITKYVAENVAKPLADIPSQMAAEAARQTNWTLLLSLIAGMIGLVTGMKVWLRNRGPAGASTR